MSGTAFFVFGGLSSFVAVALLVGAFLSYRLQKRKLKGRVSTTGTVVALERDVVNPGKPGIYCPVVEFPAPDDKIIRFESGFGTLPASHHVGQVVTVRYDPSNPQDAEIESGLTRWLVPGMLTFMGVIACCLGGFFLFFAVFF